MDHSDCDGEIAAKDCGPLADRLEELIPLLEQENEPGWPRWSAEAAERWITGLREAAAANEPVEFH